MKNKPTTIICPHIVLKSISDEDKQAAALLLENKLIAKTYMMPDFKDSEAVIKLFNSFMRLSHDATRFVYGIYFENTLIGFLNETCKTDDDIELGYVIAPDHWSKGFATEALGASINALFDMGYSSVTCGFFEENIPSKRVMEKCGMEKIDKEEYIEYRGASHRCIYYRIKKDS